MKRAIVAASVVLASCTSHHPEPVKQASKTEQRGYCVDYPNSIVPCGVQWQSEVEAAQDDPIIRAHYAGIGPLTPQVLTQDRWLYTSYMRHGQVYWTAKKVRVRAGETILTDAAGHMIRGRCGNLLRDSPEQPVEFAPPDLDTPVIRSTTPFIDGPELPAAPVPPVQTVELPQFPHSEDTPVVPTSTGHVRDSGGYVGAGWGGFGAFGFAGFERTAAVPEPVLVFPALMLLALFVSRGIYGKR